MNQRAVGEFRGTDRFQILGRIGAGGMGVVYEARDAESGRRVALKTLKHLDGQALLRFKTEFRALADLNHPNLVSLGELVEAGGEWFFTMEFVPGVDFMQFVRDQQGTPSDTVRDDALSAAVSPTEETERASPARELWAGDVATPPAFDEARLRSALVQLARGLCALHGAGKVHRDIKPANIRVTPEGQVVILDFGLVAELKAGEQSTDANIVGTVAYMAPEQAASQRVGPEADWYAVGVLLYEALLGRLPFVGAALQVILDKQKFQPPPPRASVPSVPHDLDALCSALLAVDPRERPTGREVLARLGAGEAGDVSLEAASSGHAPPFVGRRHELSVLAEAFRETRQGGAVAVLIEGESGVGKSAVVQRFIDYLTGAEPGVVVLAGRCYERESVPYKAFDGVIDALSRVMMRLDAAEAGALLPRQASLMAQVFPVLRRVKAFTMAEALQARPDPQELRTRLFAAVRETLGRLGDRRPLVIAIDDLQWADNDSRALLAEVLRQPDAPRLLLVATVRPEGADQAAAVDPGGIRRVSLSPLEVGEARDLAERLLARSPTGTSISSADIAREAGGHPLFIDELVRFAQVKGGRQASGLRLEEALLARVAALPVGAKTLIEVAAVAGGPVPQTAAARAAALPPTEFASALALLRAERLIRTSGARGADTIEPYHDRVREAVTGQLADHARTSHHHELAVALEGGEVAADPELLASHWLGAGEKDRAVTWTIRAAQAAEVALAFERAARLYRSALELDPDKPHARELRRKLGDALLNAGRGPEAAREYLALAEAATAADALELRRRAAEQLLICGHVADGLVVLDQVVAAVGMKLNRTPRRALARLLADRVRVRLRGTRFRTRDESQVAAEELMRVDVCWSASISLGLIDSIRGNSFAARHLLLALRAGEPCRIARALMIEGAFLNAQGKREKAERLLTSAEALITHMERPELRGLLALTRGITAYVAGHFLAGREHCNRAEEILRDQCRGVTWELDNAQLYGLMCMNFMGDLEGMGARVRVLITEAMRRGDLYAETNFRTRVMPYVHLAIGRPAEARSEVTEAIARWPRWVSLQHYFDLLAQCSIDMYEGAAQAAVQRISERWRGIEKAFLLRIEFIALNMYHLRARAVLALAGGAQGKGREGLLRAAEQDSRFVERSGSACATAMALLQRAAIATLRGDAELASRRLEAAAAGLDAAEMGLYAAAARRRQGQLLGGDEGRLLVDHADKWMTAQGVKNPARMTAMLAPGFPD